MTLWLTRRDLNGKPVAAPLCCLPSREIAAQPGVRSFGECLALLVAEDEDCTGESDERPILKSSRLVGYIAITAMCPAHEGFADEGRS